MPGHVCKAGNRTSYFRKKIRNSVPKKSRPPRFMFCIQISRKSLTGKWVKRCGFVDKNGRKMRFLGAILRRSGEGRQKFAGERAT